MFKSLTAINREDLCGVVGCCLSVGRPVINRHLLILIRSIIRNT